MDLPDGHGHYIITHSLLQGLPRDHLEGMHLNQHRWPQWLASL